MADIASKFINERIIKLYPSNTHEESIDWATLLLKKLLSHNNLLKEFSDTCNPTKNQLDFARSVSINNIFNDKKFPKISKTSCYLANHIRFEPILNVNLLKFNLNVLEKILTKFDEIMNNKEVINKIQKIIKTEISILVSRINEIEIEINKTPKILSNDELNNKLYSDKTPKISVITASYNLAIFVEETMRSVLNQNCIDFEHIVIDGASSDNTLDILREYPNIILVSEKDTGYPDAFWKGIQMARGKYIMQCAISDGYATDDWLNKCIEVLDNDRSVSLVWGFAGRLTENSKLSAISRSQFHYEDAPQKNEMFNYWLKTFFVYPEGNLCVRKSVLLKCYPSVSECNKDNILDWLEFSYRFNQYGYVSAHIPVLANFGRTHGNQLGEQLGNKGSLKGKYKDFKKKIKCYRYKVLSGNKEHQFIDSDGNVLDIKFDKKRFLKEFLLYKISNLFKINKKFFKPVNYIKYVRKIMHKIK